MANPRPKCKFPTPKDVTVVARKSIAVKLPPEIDAWVRTLPNKSEWLCQAIADAYERDMHQHGIMSVHNSSPNMPQESITTQDT